MISVDWFAAVAAPVGRLMVPLMLLIFQVPLCVAATVPSTVRDPPLSVTGIAVWSVGRTTLRV